MAKRGFYNGKRYAPTKPGGVLQPGTVEYELARRQVMRRQREEDDAFLHKCEEKDDMYPEPIIGRMFRAVVRFFRAPGY